MAKSMGKAMARGYSAGAHGHGGHHTFQPSSTSSNHMNNPAIAFPEHNAPKSDMKSM